MNPENMTLSERSQSVLRFHRSRVSGRSTFIATESRYWLPRVGDGKKGVKTNGCGILGEGN